MDQLFITLVGKDLDRETKARAQLEKIITQYDLTKYFFTTKIQIEYHSIPHSHPILTLNTKYLENDDEMLSTFIHEQFHWFESQNKNSRDQAISTLRKIYPEVPEFPQGARSEESTYLHLIVCWLEFAELKKLVGDETAQKIIREHDHYTWVYQTILKDYDEIKEILRDNNLLLPN